MSDDLFDEMFYNATMQYCQYCQSLMDDPDSGCDCDRATIDKLEGENAELRELVAELDETLAAVSQLSYDLDQAQIENTVIEADNVRLEARVNKLREENKRLTAALGQCSRARAELLETLRRMRE